MKKAKEAGATIKEADPKKLDYLCGGANHQGVVAVAAVKEYATVEDLFRRAQEKDEPPFFVVCDELEDPTTWGPSSARQSAPGHTGSSSQAAQRGPHLRRGEGLGRGGGIPARGPVGNLPSLLEELKARGLWIYAADMDGSPWCQTDFTGPTALVIGSEGRGVGRLVKEKADFVVSLLKGKHQLAERFGGGRHPLL